LRVINERQFYNAISVAYPERLGNSEAVMKTNEFNKLVKEYGTEKANKAVRWFTENNTEAFRNAVHQAQYCITNEYLWF
jgi:hypothetical protein